MHRECTQEKLPVDNCIVLGGHRNRQTCYVSTPCARPFESMGEVLLFSFFGLRGVSVGVVYAGNNQGFKCLTGRCDHRTPLTMTMPAQSWLILHYFFCFRSATSDTGPNCQANNSHWDIRMDGSTGESYLKPGHCTHVWLPLRFSASYFGN